MNTEQRKAMGIPTDKEMIDRVQRIGVRTMTTETINTSREPCGCAVEPYCPRHEDEQDSLMERILERRKADRTRAFLEGSQEEPE